jgi:hypothetical protein
MTKRVISVAMLLALSTAPLFAKEVNQHDLPSLLAFIVPGLAIVAVLLVVMLATGSSPS